MPDARLFWGMGRLAGCRIIPQSKITSNTISSSRLHYKHKLQRLDPEDYVPDKSVSFGIPGAQPSLPLPKLQPTWTCC